MVPLRFIGEALGRICMGREDPTVTFSLDGKELKVVIDQLSPEWMFRPPSSAIDHRADQVYFEAFELR
jgi:hypothetical protein